MSVNLSVIVRHFYNCSNQNITFYILNCMSFAGTCNGIYGYLQFIFRETIKRCISTFTPMRENEFLLVSNSAVKIYKHSYWNKFTIILVCLIHPHLHWERNLHKSIWNKEILYQFYSLGEFFFAIRINIFGPNVYYFSLKTHFLEVKTPFFDLNEIILIVNTFSLRP